MRTEIYVNLPVKDLKRSNAFFESAPRKPQDQGFMYGHGFEDPDGHIWELISMEPAK